MKCLLQNNNQQSFKMDMAKIKLPIGAIFWKQLQLQEECWLRWSKEVCYFVDDNIVFDPKWC